MLEKKALSPEVLEAQTVLELPDREMMALLNVVVVDVIDVRDVTIQANVCPNANVIGAQENVDIDCTIE